MGEMNEMTVARLEALSRLFKAQDDAKIEGIDEMLKSVRKLEEAVAIAKESFEKIKTKCDEARAKRKELLDEEKRIGDEIINEGIDSTNEEKLLRYLRLGDINVRLMKIGIEQDDILIASLNNVHEMERRLAKAKLELLSHWKD